MEMARIQILFLLNIIFKHYNQIIKKLMLKMFINDILKIKIGGYILCGNLKIM